MSKKFFEERTEASQVKAQIVNKYFRAWAGIVAPRARDTLAPDTGWGRVVGDK